MNPDNQAVEEIREIAVEKTETISEKFEGFKKWALTQIETL